MESERGTQALAIAGSSSPTSANDVTAARVAGQDLVARLSQVRATGRIVLPLLPGMSSINDLPAISLENGDRFIVPAVPTAVNVVGAVYDQNSFLFRVKRPVSYYLKLAGGATRDADAHRAFIIRADGSVIGRNTVKNLGAWSKGFEDISLNAGDSIVVPEKTLRPPQCVLSSIRPRYSHNLPWRCRDTLVLKRMQFADSCSWEFPTCRTP